MLFWTEFIWTVALGLVIGSFISCASYRIPRGISLLMGRSRCPVCNHLLGPFDLVPVLSYIIQRGKCRYCRAKISWRYPVIEVLTAAAMTLYYMVISRGSHGFTNWIQLTVGLFFLIYLILAAVIDLEHGKIPNKITCPGIITGILLSYFTVGIISAIEGAAIIGGVLIMSVLVFHGCIGGGDVKMAAMIGAFCGLDRALVAMVITSLFGVLWAGMLILSGRANFKTAIKYGPFLAIGGWLAYLL